MKITLSRSQWEGIGKKAGWMKKAENMDSIDSEVRKLMGVMTSITTGGFRFYDAALGAINASIKSDAKFDIPAVHKMVEKIVKLKEIYEKKCSQESENIKKLQNNPNYDHTAEAEHYYGVQ